MFTLYRYHVHRTNKRASDSSIVSALNIILNGRRAGQGWGDYSIIWYIIIVHDGDIVAKTHLWCILCVYVSAATICNIEVKGDVWWVCGAEYIIWVCSVLMSTSKRKTRQNRIDIFFYKIYFFFINYTLLCIIISSRYKIYITSVLHYYVYDRTVVNAFSCYFPRRNQCRFSLFATILF